MYIVLRREGLVLENGHNLSKSGCITRYSYTTRNVLDSSVYRIDISELSGRTVYMAMGLDDTTSTMVSNLVRVVLLDDLSTEKAARENVPLPTEVTLYQNYPNPFNPTTAISFYLPTGMNFALEVFNNLGMKTRVLESGWRDAGAHTVQFDAAGLPSGVYYYKLTTGDRVLTKRMALVK